jgi:hypothetical protein
MQDPMKPFNQIYEILEKNPDATVEEIKQALPHLKESEIKTHMRQVKLCF